MRFAFRSLFHILYSTSFGSRTCGTSLFPLLLPHWFDPIGGDQTYGCADDGKQLRIGDWAYLLEKPPILVPPPPLLLLPSLYAFAPLPFTPPSSRFSKIRQCPLMERRRRLSTMGSPPTHSHTAEAKCPQTPVDLTGEIEHRVAIFTLFVACFTSFFLPAGGVPSLGQ